MVDGAVYSRIADAAERSGHTVAEVLDKAIHRALDAIYLERGRQ